MAIVAGGMLTAPLIGVALAVNAPLGAALVVGGCYAALVAVNLPLAIAVWLPLVFLEGIGAFNAAGKAGGVLLAAVWIATLPGNPDARAILNEHRGTLATLVLLLLWLTLSLAWADDLGRGLESIWHWWAVALLFCVVMTSMSPVAARRVLIAFVVGGVLSVLAGIANGDLTAATAATAGDARLGSAAGDPNILASGLVPGVVLAAALATAVRSVPFRCVLVVAILVLTAGVIASQSRGAVLAAVATAVAALVFFKRRRMHAIVVCMLAVGVAFALFTVNPLALERLTTFDTAGSGRSDLWTVGWRVAEDHPIAGVGLNNFGAVAREYVRETGSLERVNQLETGHMIHNVYLQFLVDTGAVGLALFLVFAWGCLRAAWAAGNRFQAIGRDDLEALSRGILVGTIGMLAASYFISHGVDRRLWVLLALGPAMLHIARREEAQARFKRINHAATANGARLRSVRAAPLVRP
jgi:O-antigen ligase